jgi:hypothetical protein
VYQLFYNLLKNIQKIQVVLKAINWFLYFF